MVGPWTFVTLPLVFVTNLASIATFTKKMYKGKSEAVAIEEGESGSSKKEKKGFFLLKSAFTSLWLPSVVGNWENMLLVSSISTLFTKLAILLLILILAFCGLLQKMHKHPFTIWCEDEWDERAQEGVTLCSFRDNNSTYCFDNENIQQKLRVCSSDNFERNFRIGLLIAIILTNCASLAASYRLNRLSDYVQLFLETKSVHRSAIFELVNSNKKKDNEVFEEIMLKDGIEDAVNRHNHAGDTPLGRACATGDSWKAFLLWNAGAEPLVGRKPQVKEHLKKYALLDIDGEPVRKETLRPLGIQHVVERHTSHTAQMKPLFLAWMTSADQDQGAAEQNMLDLFESLNVNTMSVPTEPDGTDEHSIVEVAKRIRQWNSAHEQKCENSATNCDPRT